MNILITSTCTLVNRLTTLKLTIYQIHTVVVRISVVRGTVSSPLRSLPFFRPVWVLANLRLTLSNTQDCPCNMHVTHVSFSAEVSDYVGLSENVTLLHNTTQKCQLLNIVNDSVLEETESLTVSLSLNGKENSVLLYDDITTVLIEDNDGMKRSDTIYKVIENLFECLSSFHNS